MNVVTRFAPSPTGFLHIGGVRTALFNLLFARHHGGKYLLRIEDTDKKRSIKDAIDAILDGLNWLNLNPDEKPIFQSNNKERHQRVATELLSAGLAYHCYCSQEELLKMRENARALGTSRLYDGKWRDKDPADAPRDVAPVLRFKTPIQGTTEINDLVQGPVNVSNQQLDDMILLRADGTPTYLLSAVVDDHDMGVTHIIRGDDHLTNAFRQTQLFKALKWDTPIFGHIPLIHGPEGGKLSKRHGALGIDHYKKQGYLPDAIVNYLMRLGWSHGNDEIFTLAKAIKWFDISNVGKGPSRIDFNKIDAINSHYIKEADDEILVGLIKEAVNEKLNLSDCSYIERRLTDAMPGLKLRAKTLLELIDSSLFYFKKRPLGFDRKALLILDKVAKDRLKKLTSSLEKINPWNPENIQSTLKDFSKNEEINLGEIAQPLRATLTGTTISPSIFEVASILGKEETMARIKDILDN